MAPPAFFGPKVWTWIDFSCFEAFADPDHPTAEEKADLQHTLKVSVPYVLACKACRAHYEVLLLALPPDLRSRAAISYWNFTAHNCVNKCLKKKKWKWRQIKSQYQKRRSSPTYIARAFHILWEVAQIALFEQKEELSYTESARLIEFICVDLPRSIPPNARALSDAYTTTFHKVKSVLEPLPAARDEIGEYMTRQFTALEAVLFGASTLSWPAARSRYEQERQSFIATERPPLRHPVGTIVTRQERSAKSRAKSVHKEENIEENKEERKGKEKGKRDRKREEKEKERHTPCTLKGEPSHYTSYPLDTLSILLVGMLLTVWLFGKRNK